MPFAEDLVALLQPKFPLYPVEAQLLEEAEVERILGRRRGIARVEVLDDRVRVHTEPIVPVYLVSLAVDGENLATLQGEDAGDLANIAVRLEAHFARMLRDREQI